MNSDIICRWCELLLYCILNVGNWYFHVFACFEYALLHAWLSWRRPRLDILILFDLLWVGDSFQFRILGVIFRCVDVHFQLSLYALLLCSCNQLYAVCFVKWLIMMSHVNPLWKSLFGRYNFDVIRSRVVGVLSEGSIDVRAYTRWPRFLAFFVVDAAGVFWSQWSEVDGRPAMRPLAIAVVASLWQAG